MTASLVGELTHLFRKQCAVELGMFEKQDEKVTQLQLLGTKMHDQCLRVSYNTCVMIAQLARQGI